MGEWAGRFVPSEVRNDANFLVRTSLDRPLPGVFVMPREREERVADKMRRFRAAGPGKIIYLSDFDRTKTRDSDAATILAHLTGHLPSVARDKQLAESKVYRAKEIANTLDEEDIRRWWAGPLDLYAEHKLHFPTVAASFVDVAEPRPELLETLSVLDKLGIPLVVTSGGVKDMIDFWCAHYGVTPAAVVSTQFILDGQGNIIGWDRGSLVHIRNKRDRVRGVLSQFIDERPLVINIGDVMEDARVVKGYQNENVLNIRIKEPRPGETEEEKEAFRQETFKEFDLLIEDGGYAAVLEFLKSLDGSEQRATHNGHSVEQRQVWPSSYL